GNFSCPVRTEIKENDRVLISDHSRRMSILFYNCRKYKLIGSVPVVRRLDSCRSACCFLAFAIYQRTVCLFYTVPAVITVHSIVASHHCRHFSDADLLHLCFQLLYIFFSGCRRCISSV